MRVTPTAVADTGPGSIRTGVDHVDPFHSRASPEASTAAQNDVVGQETPANDDEVPKGLGCVHCSPFHWEMPPETDMQNEAVTQEIADTDPQSPLVPCHEPPAKAKAFPSASTAAQYPTGAHPTAPSPLAPSSVVGANHTCPFQLVTSSPAVVMAAQ